MRRSISRIFAGAAVFLAATVLIACGATSANTAIPNPAVDDVRATAKGQQTAVLAGGCFWGIQAVFEHVKGITSATAGYSGGAANTADYETVSTGTSGHAESVKITYDPSEITYGQILKVFFAVAHDPTELDRQGPDSGTQYRSAIFYANGDQQRIAQAYIEQLDRAKVYSGPIVTQVVALSAFYPAEAYHQDFALHHPHYPYIVINDLPKISHLHQQLPEFYRN
ncbi:MAG: peptide-methionine (S)-S-oxide reductase MsrA [Candidatus Acidiferrales bacterium]